MKVKGAIKSAAKNVSKWTEKNSPTILLTVGIVGLLTTTVIAVKNTPKAVKKLDEHKEKLNDIRKDIGHSDSDSEIKELKKEKTGVYLDILKDLGICYGPAVLLAGSSTACLLYSHKIEHGRLTAVATAYQISETARREYKDKVLEVIGKNKEADIREAIAKDHINDNPPDKESDIYNSTQDTLCYDSLSGRYFRSNKTKLQQISNKLNKRLFNEMYISLNELYDELEMDHIRLGDDVGWNADEEIDFIFTSMLSNEGVPILVLEYRVAPRYDYRKLY